MLKKMLVLTMFVVFFGVISVVKYKASPNLQITFYDIGQGDSTLLKFPGNYSILIDGGPDNRVLSYLGGSINPFLKNIDLVVATHNHADHTVGLKSVIEQYNIAQLIVPTDILGISSEVSDRKVSVTKVNAGDKILVPTPLSNSVITILWPPSEIFSKNCAKFCDINTNDPNYTSLVFLLEYKNFKAIFTGDAPREVLDAILDEVGDVDLVKVPHQGSKDSFLEEFYRKIKPEIAVIPVGKNNYGHPDATVINFLENIGAKVYTTLDFGSVSIETNGYQMAIR